MKSKPLFLHNNLDKYFYNRKEELKRINYQINALKYDLPQQLLITGYRGVGKSYLLKKVINESDSEIIYTYLDFSKIYALHNEELTIEIVLIELLKTMHESINNQIYKNKFKQKIQELIENIKLKKYDFNEASEIFKIPIPHVESNYRKLSQFVMEFPQKIIDNITEIKGFVIIIDEFQILKKVNDLDKFFWLIRSFNQTQHNVSYIFTGSISKTSEIIQEINGENGAFGGRMIIMEIKPFTQDETKSYFEECMPEIKFTSDGFERFYKCTRGIPLYINSFYNVMDSSQVYDSKLVKETFFMNMNQILIMWFRVWSSLNKHEKNIIKILVEQDSLSWTELFNKTNISRGTFNKYLKNLLNKGVIEYFNDEYIIGDNMLKTWLKNEKETNGTYPL